MTQRTSRKKISNISVSHETTSFINPNSDSPESVFRNILEEVGLILGKNDEPNEISVDQAIFLAELSKKLTVGSSALKQKFISGFEKHLDDELRIKWCLLPTVTSLSCQSARSTSQDSLAHMLLDIEVVQEKVSEFLLDKLMELSYSETNALYERSEGKSVACLIVSQFRWLNKLVNSEALTDKLIQVIEATQTEIQRDIIYLLPDVLMEFDHPKVAKYLSENLLHHQELNATILDTLTNLNIGADLLSEIRKKVLRKISIADLPDLPVILKFVLQDLNSSEEASEIVQELHKNLDFNSTFNPIIASTPKEPKSLGSTKDVCSFVLNVISQSLRFQKYLCNSWIKQLESIKGPKNHRSLEILVIIIMFSLEGYEKKVEHLLKNKVKTGDINEDLLHITFRCHHEVLQEYASILLKIAETFLSIAEPNISLFGNSIYVKCFIWFDSFYKQEIIGNLITHVGKKSESETNAALNTLLSLARNHTQKVAPYSLFLRNLLDHLEQLTLNQIRKVHEMLSILAYQGGREGSILLDDMMIIIRKQVTNKSMKYRKMGVVAALMAAKTAAEKDNESIRSDVSISSDAFDSETCYQHSIKLLELVAESTSESLEAFALFCDELSDIMLAKKLGNILLEWIGQNILADFEEMYIIDVSVEDYNKQGVGPKFGLDDVEEPVAIDLYSIVLKENNRFKMKNVQNGDVSLSKRKIFKKTHDQSKILQALLQFSSEESSSGEQTHNSSPLKIAPLFRLLRIFRHIQDGNLDSIDALLGCAIVLPELKSSNFSSLSLEEQRNVLHTLFYCVNWIRENLNAFSTSEDEDIKCNVLSRLQLLIVLENLICDYLKKINDYIPPLANFDCDELLNSFKLPSKKPSKRIAKVKKGKSKKAKTNADTEQIEATGSVLENSKALESEDEEFESKDDINNAAMLKKLQPFFRELDIDVFNLFKVGVTFEERSDILANNKITSTALHPAELNFLLEDLILKLQYCFSNSVFHLKTTQKKVGFSRLDIHTPTKVATFCIGLLPALCTLAEECTSFFKNALEKADGIEDSLFMRSAIAQHVAQSLILILKVIQQIVSWKNLNLVENVALLKTALHTFAVKIEKCRESDPMEKIGVHAVDYLCLFANSVPSLDCAANLVQLLSAVLCYTNSVEAKMRVSDIALMFLKKKWVEIENKSTKNAEINAHLKIILETYLRNSASMLKSLDYLCGEALAELLNAEEENCVFNSLSKSSLICYYKIMFNNLATYTKEYFTNKNTNDKEKMSQWEVSFKIFHVLTNLIKNFGARYYVGTCLKYSREFLTTFLKYGMPLMDKMFVSNKESVISLMKSLQSSTRYLQHVCSHSKVLKDVSLIKHVPFLKKNLEAFVFRIKVMLAINKCEEAFWIGNLKNRDLKGVEISSQVPVDSDDGISENDENNPESDKEELVQNKSGSDLSGIDSDSD